MKSLFIAILLVVFSATTFADEGQSNNNPGALKAPNKTPDFPSCWTQFLQFDTAADVFSFYIEKTEDTAAGILRVQTLDCCIPGDEWQSAIESRKPRWRTDVATGDGNISTYSGDAYVAPFNAGTVEISYDVGVDSFPAGMSVEFCYSRERDDGNDELLIIPN